MRNILGSSTGIDSNSTEIKDVEFNDLLGKDARVILFRSMQPWCWLSIIFVETGWVIFNPLGDIEPLSGG